MKKTIILLVLVMAMLTGCTNDVRTASYEKIPSGQAARMMAMEPDYAILDVRTKEEYERQHIAGAYCIPHEQLNEKTAGAALKNREQLILVYCRDGERSEDAAKKLADMGYTNVYHFDGCDTWRGQVESGICAPHIG